MIDSAESMKKHFFCTDLGQTRAQRKMRSVFSQNMMHWITEMTARAPKSFMPTGEALVCAAERVENTLHRPNSISPRLSIKPQGR